LVSFQIEDVTFLKKSNQKTFAPGGVGTGIAFNRLHTGAIKGNPGANARRSEVFLLLFLQKKKFFPYLE